MRAALLKEYGDPVANIEVVDMAEPASPGTDEVLVLVEYAPVNPADVLLLMGYYAVKPTLPSVAGNEGVGTVLSVGPGVVDVKVGDRVALPLSSFTWRERMVIPAKDLVALPIEADLQQLAMVAVNPGTASLLLTEFKELHAGDWIVQNAANSGVGRSVIAYARERGIKTVNIVRRPELIEDLKVAGADIVLLNGEDIAERIRAAVDGAAIGFGIDGLCGPETGVIASILAPQGTLVTYGAMTYAPLSISPADVIYKGLKMTGLFIGNPEHARKFPTAIQQSAKLIAAGKLRVPVAAVYPLSSVKEAVAHAQRGGKVLLDISGH